jgi:ribose transport system permease protein
MSEFTTPTGPQSDGNVTVTGSRTTSRLTLSTLLGIVGTYGLLILTVLLAILFSLLLPNTFPTQLTLDSILSTTAITALLALSEMIVASIGQIDLSIGYGIGISHILAIGLITRSNLPWGLAVVMVLLVGMLIGLINGLLVQVAKIDSFIATLGVGTVIYGISNWYTNGQQIVGTLPNGFISISNTFLFGIPLPAFYVAVIAILLWIAFEFLPVGRYLYALGSNARAAELSGIPRPRYIIGAFVAAGLLMAFAGVVLASRIQVGQSNVGPDYLLPAIVGALLGATTIRTGRVNVWGTIIAVLLLAVGVAGIEQIGAAFFVNPLFNGLTLIIAVGLAGYAARRRLRAKVKEGR